MARWVALLGFVGCADRAELEAPPTPPPPGFVAPTPPPWLQTGDVGDVLFVREARTVVSRQSLSIAAVFADDLQDMRYPAGCAPGSPLCLPAHAEIGTVYDTTNAALDPELSSFRWVGDTLAVGDLEAPFGVQPENAIGGYTARTPVIGLLQFEYPLSFSGGEWGDLHAENTVSLPTSLEILEPTPLQPVVNPNALQAIRWEPEGGSDLVLTVQGEGVSTARLVEDDGEAWLDFSELRFDGPLDVRLSRVSAPTTLDVNGNTLTVRSVAQQAWCVVETCEAPFEGTVLLPFDFCWSSTTCGSSRFRLDPDGTWSTEEGFIGEWTWDCCTNELVVSFTTGTRYSATLVEDGCFEGEMESWSGNLGTWSGCLAD